MGAKGVGAMIAGAALAVGGLALGGGLLLGLKGAQIGWYGFSIFMSGLLAYTHRVSAPRPERMVVSQLNPLPVVYGRARVNGSLIMATTTADGNYLWLVMALCHGPIDAIEDIYLDGQRAVLASGTIRGALSDRSGGLITAVGQDTPCTINVGGLIWRLYRSVDNGVEIIPSPGDTEAWIEPIYGPFSAHTLPIAGDTFTVPGETGSPTHTITALDAPAQDPSSPYPSAYKVHFTTVWAGGAFVEDVLLFIAMGSGDPLEAGDVIAISLRPSSPGAYQALNGQFQILDKTSAFTYRINAIGFAGYNYDNAHASTAMSWERVNGQGYSGYLDFAKYLGTDTDDMTSAPGATHGPTADSTVRGSDLTAVRPEWTTADHPSQGVAVLYLRLRLNDGLYHGNIPSVSCLVRGRTLYDPRDASTAWSTNPALAIRDYLTSARYGPGDTIAAADIDDGADDSHGLRAEAEYDDEQVYAPVGAFTRAITSSSASTNRVLVTGHTLSPGDKIWIQNHIGSTPSLDGLQTVDTAPDADHITLVAVTITVGGTAGTVQKVGLVTRHECNGALDTSQPIKENISALLTARRGQLSYWGGLYHLFTRRVVPVSYLDGVSRGIDEDLVEIGGDVTIRLPRAADRPNTLFITFLDPNRNWQPHRFQWPPVGVTNPYLVEDNNFVVRRDIDLPMTIDQYMAQRIGMILLEEARSSAQLEVDVKEEALKYAVGDRVPVTLTFPGWSAKSFWVMALGATSDAKLTALLAEYQATAYDQQMTDDALLPRDTGIPNPWTTLAPPTSLVLVSGTSDPRIRASWVGANDARVDHYELQAKRVTPADPNVTADEDYKNYAPATSDSTFGYIAVVNDGDVWNVRARSVTKLGVASEWLTVTNYTATILKVALFTVARTVNATGVTYEVTFGDKCDRVEAYTLEDPSSATKVPPQTSEYLSFVARIQNGAVQSFRIAGTETYYRDTLLVAFTVDGVQGLILGPLQDQQVDSGASPSAAPSGLTLGTVTQATQPITWSNNTDTLSATRVKVDGVIVFTTAVNATSCTLGDGTVCPAFAPGSMHTVDIDHIRNGQTSASAGLQSFTTTAVGSAPTNFKGGPMTFQNLPAGSSKWWGSFVMSWDDVGAWEIFESINLATPGSGAQIGAGSAYPSGGFGYSRRTGDGYDYYYWLRGTSPVTDWAALGGTDTFNPVTYDTP